MLNFKTLLLAWLSTILEHLGVIGTGGIVVLLIQMAEKKWPARFNWQTSRRVFLVFLLFAIFQSWESEYLSRLGREMDLAKAHEKIDGLRRSIDTQTKALNSEHELSLSALKSDCSVKDAISQTLQKQNRDQQTSINGCLTQAMGLLKPATLKVAPVVFDSDNTNVAVRIVRWLVMVNQPRQPHLVVFCSQGMTYMQSANLKLIGGSVPYFTGVSGRLGPAAWELSQGSGTWAPETPLLVTLEYRGSENLACSFEPR